jgi:hypothetical protein
MRNQWAIAIDPPRITLVVSIHGGNHSFETPPGADNHSTFDPDELPNGSFSTPKVDPVFNQTTLESTDKNSIPFVWDLDLTHAQPRKTTTKTPSQKDFQRWSGRGGMDSSGFGSADFSRRGFGWCAYRPSRLKSALP